MSKYDKFYDYLADLNQNHLRLLELLEAKLVAIQKFDIDQLDEIIKEEQVYVLVSKGFDSNIGRFRRELSLSGEKLSEIIPDLPDEEHVRFRELFKRLQTSLSQTHAINQKCQELLEERLYSLNKSIRQLDKTASAAPYAKPGGGDKAGQSPHFMTKLV